MAVIKLGKHVGICLQVHTISVTQYSADMKHTVIYVYGVLRLDNKLQLEFRKKHRMVKKIPFLVMPPPS